MNNPAAEIIESLCSRGLTIGTVESATGGLMAHLLTNRFVIPAQLVPYRDTGTGIQRLPTQRLPRSRSQ
jgi:hypothetical protein